MPEAHPPFRRVLLKLSGEALAGDQSQGLDPATLDGVAAEIARLNKAGIELALVIGGGNIFRGLRADAVGVERVTGDYMGMLATVINALAMKAVLARHACRAAVMTAIPMAPIAEVYSRDAAVQRLTAGEILIFAAGTGQPYFTTDTAAALRALEIGADLLLKATKVDGVYDADPIQEPRARRFETLSYREMLERKLKVMDLTAVLLAQEGRLPVLVFNLLSKDHLYRAVMGEKVGTFVSGEAS